MLGLKGCKWTKKIDVKNYFGQVLRSTIIIWKGKKKEIRSMLFDLKSIYIMKKI